jgi:hypothetical protein
MDGRRVDEIARSLAGEASRRGALKAAGVALLAAVAPALVPDPVLAVSRAKRRCLHKKGFYLAHGACHCAVTCKTSVGLTCQNNDACFCGETVEGTGACVLQGAVTIPGGCAASSECATNDICVRFRNCPESGGACDETTPCPTGNACLNGRCQRTFCFHPCPAP